METLGYLLLRWVFAVFAVYRVSRMLALEEGPFSLFDRLRDSVGGDNWLSRGVNCPYCIGFYVALAAALAVTERASAVELVMMWLSIAGAQTYLQATEGEP